MMGFPSSESPNFQVLILRWTMKLTSRSAFHIFEGEELRFKTTLPGPSKCLGRMKCQQKEPLLTKKHTRQTGGKKFNTTHPSKNRNQWHTKTSKSVFAWLISSWFPLPFPKVSMTNVKGWLSHIYSHRFHPSDSKGTLLKTWCPNKRIPWAP